MTLSLFRFTNKREVRSFLVVGRHLGVHVVSAVLYDHGSSDAVMVTSVSPEPPTVPPDSSGVHPDSLPESTPSRNFLNKN